MFGTGSGKDKIMDFDAGSGAEDVDLSGMASITGFSDLMNNHMTQVGTDVVINGGGDDKRPWWGSTSAIWAPATSCSDRRGPAGTRAGPDSGACAAR